MKQSTSKVFYWVLALVVSFLFIVMSGEDPFLVLSVLIKSTFGSSYDVGMALFYSTPLILTGLSVAIAFRAGLFNIGAEGQTIVGTVTAMILSVEFKNLGPLVAIFLVFGGSFIMGGLWAWIAGWIKAKRGGHEVISTIMLNFIAAGAASYIVINHYKNPHSQNPESLSISQNFRVPILEWFDAAPVSWIVILGVCLCFCSFLFFRYTKTGFELDVVGSNDRVAKYSGINVQRHWMISMFLAGGFAGIAGLGDLLSNTGRYVLDSSPGFGFMGIAVALLARGKPIPIIFSALFFGILHKGASDLDFEFDHITRDLSMVIQAVFILFVSSNRRFEWIDRLDLKPKLGMKKTGESSV